MKLFDECGQKQFMQRWTQKYGGNGFPTDSSVSRHQLFGHDHHIFGFETLIRLNRFLVQIPQSCECMQLHQRMKQIQRKMSKHILIKLCFAIRNCV